MKLSVVIPCFNAEVDLSACVTSLQRSLLPQDEIIIVDDASTDGSLAVARRLATTGTVKVHALPQNMGVSAARNEGVQIATGEVVGFVDPDDLVTTTYRSVLVPPLEDDGVDICIGRHRISDASRSLVRTAPYPDARLETSGPEALALMAERRLPSSVCFMTFRRSFLLNADPFRPDTRFEDFIFLADNLAKAKRVVLDDRVVYTYQRGHVSETGTLRPSVLDLLTGASAMRRALTLHEIPAAPTLSLITDASIRVSICDQAAVFGFQNPELAKHVTSTATQGLNLGIALRLIRKRRLVLGVQVGVLSVSPSLYGMIIRIVRRMRSGT